MNKKYERQRKNIKKGIVKAINQMPKKGLDTMHFDLSLDFDRDIIESEISIFNLDNNNYDIEFIGSIISSMIMVGYYYLKISKCIKMPLGELQPATLCLGHSIEVKNFKEDNRI